MFLKQRTKSKEKITLENISSMKEISLRDNKEEDLAVIFCNIITTSLNPSAGDLLRINLKLLKQELFTLEI